MINFNIDGDDLVIIAFFICYTVYKILANGYLK